VNRDEPSDSLMSKIDACCDRFEADWKRGAPPEIAPYLAGWVEPERSQLFECLLALDVDYRSRGGTGLGAEEYARRFPEFAEVIARHFDPRGDGLTALSDESPATPRGVAELSSRADDRYELRDEIARGGMGAVLKARDTNLGRELAIKVVRPEHRANAAVVQRFLAEAKIGGQLQHPGIVPVYELGRFEDQRPFISMKLVKGETLAALLAARRSVEENRPRFLGIFRQICETLAYVHSRSVIHRDLKPQNVMVGAFGEVQVMDWGLAKVLEATRPREETSLLGATVILARNALASEKTAENDSQTMAGSVIGTPAYMPPEQANGDLAAIDERVDVFALGAILCQILTGQPPYAAPDVMKILDMARRAALDECFARLDACGADSSLSALARDCLAADPSKRPRNAGIVAERITGYLAGVESRLRAVEVERAAETARAEQALHTAAEADAKAKAERRARKLQVRMAVTGVGLLALASIAAILVALTQSRLKREAVDARGEAIEAGKAEAQQRRRADLTLADMQTARGLGAAERDHAGEAALWFVAAAMQAEEAGGVARRDQGYLRARNWLRHAVHPIAAISVEGTPSSLEFQSNGPHLVIQADKSLRIWNWAEGRMLDWPTALRNVNVARLSPDGTLIALGFPSREKLPGDDVGKPDEAWPDLGLQVRRLADGEILFQRDSGQVVGLAFNADGRFLATSGAGIHIWDVPEQKLLPIPIRPGPVVRALALNPAGDRLAAAGGDRKVRLYSLAESKESLSFLSIPHAPRRHSPPLFVNNDEELLTISAPGEMKRFQVSNGEAAAGDPLKVKPTSLSHIAASADGKWIAVGGYYGPEIRSLVDPGAAPISLTHSNYVNDYTFSPDGAFLVTASADQTSLLWSLAESRLVGSLVHSASVERCAWAQDSRRFATAQSDGLIRVWELPEGDAAPARVAGWGQRARLSLDGKLLTPGLVHESVSGDPRTDLKRVVVRDAKTGEPVGGAISLSGFLADSCVCDEGRIVATVAQGRGSRVGRLAFWDLTSGELRGRLHPVSGATATIAPRGLAGNQVAVLSSSGEVIIHDAKSGALAKSRKVSEPHDFAEGRLRLEYTPDARTLVVLTRDDRIHVLDADTLEPRFAPIAPVIEEGPCRSFAISKDGRLLATAVNGRNMAAVWSLEDGRLLSPPMPHPGDIYGIFCLAFSPDGTRLLTGSKDGQARYWDWAAGQLAGPTLAHGDEIWSVAISADGRFAVVGLRGHPQQVRLWDLASGKPLAPPIRLIESGEPHGSHAVTISPDGSRVFSCGGSSLRIVDLSRLLAPPTSSAREMLLLSELAAGRRIEQGDLDPLTQEQWMERWEALRAMRKTPSH
jgi:serine/threonine protein kinase/WD40 repeat protein